MNYDINSFTDEGMITLYEMIDGEVPEEIRELTDDDLYTILQAD